jgi:hypothetical protein
MLRDFCLNCGSPLSITPRLGTQPRTSICVCEASSELLTLLERQEQAHLPVYAQARPLLEPDFQRLIQCDGHALTVADLIGAGYAANAIRACMPRVAERELVQLVYIKRVGSVLFTWPFCEPSFAGPHQVDRLRSSTAQSSPTKNTAR